jgi:hypothetical protein
MTSPESRGPVQWRRVRPAIVLGVVLLSGAGVWAAVATGDKATEVPERQAATSPAGEVATPEATPEPTPSTTAAPPQEVVAGREEAAARVPDFVELPPVPITAVAEFGTEVSARVVSTKRVDGQAAGPGERSGPALELTIELTNDTRSAVSLDYVVVNLYAPDGAPGSTLAGDPRSAPFSGSLAPGQSRSGVYVIRLPDPEAKTARVSVSYGAEAPTVVFEGEVAS